MTATGKTGSAVLGSEKSGARFWARGAGRQRATLCGPMALGMWSSERGRAGYGNVRVRQKSHSMEIRGCVPCWGEPRLQEGQVLVSSPQAPPAAPVTVVAGGPASVTHIACLLTEALCFALSENVQKNHPTLQLRQKRPAHRSSVP